MLFVFHDGTAVSIGRPENLPYDVVVSLSSYWCVRATDATSQPCWHLLFWWMAWCELCVCVCCCGLLDLAFYRKFYFEAGAESERPLSLVIYITHKNVTENTKSLTAVLR